MNLNLKEVICTSPDGETFQRLTEVHIRGNSIKYLRVPDQVIDMVKEERFRNRSQKSGRGRGGKFQKK